MWVLDPSARRCNSQGQKTPPLSTVKNRPLIVVAHTLWIGEAITRHAARSLKARLRFAANKPARAEVRTGSSRSFNVPTSAIELMRAAISQEQAEERWLSDSSWCAEAVDAAISTARERNGGELPTPPARLPNRLVR